MSLYHLSVFIHILSAIFWIGGMLFTVAVLVPDEQPDHPSTNRMRKISSWLGRLNLLLGLAILYYALRLLRG